MSFRSPYISGMLFSSLIFWFSFCCNAVLVPWSIITHNIQIRMNIPSEKMCVDFSFASFQWRRQLLKRESVRWSVNISECHLTPLAGAADAFCLLCQKPRRLLTCQKLQGMLRSSSSCWDILVFVLFKKAKFPTPCISPSHLHTARWMSLSGISCHDFVSHSNPRAVFSVLIESNRCGISRTTNSLEKFELR